MYLKNQGLHLRLLWVLGLSVLCLLLLSCQTKAVDKQGPLRRAPLRSPPAQLQPEFLERGLRALSEKVGPEVHTLEIRAEGRQLSLQVETNGKLMQVDYVERPPKEAGELTESQVFGPDPIAVRGSGGLEDNLFVLSEVDLAGIAKSFDVAKRAVDPQDGRVFKLVVRRFLPFSDKLRARIYVDSPRMSGAIDTNERGVPLKKR